VFCSAFTTHVIEIVSVEQMEIVSSYSHTCKTSAVELTESALEESKSGTPLSSVRASATGSSSTQTCGREIPAGSVCSRCSNVHSKEYDQ
jgi:hypothetical protein